MCEAFDYREGSVNIGGRLIINFCFADDIAINAEEEEEADVLEYRLDITTTRYKMETCPGMTNTPKASKERARLKVRGRSGELQVPWRKIISSEGSNPEILFRVAQTTAAFSRLKII